MKDTESVASALQKSNQTKKIALWALGIMATAIAGFANEQVQDQLCLKMPTAASMEYPAAKNGTVKYSSLWSISTRDNYDGKNVSFRAIYLDQIDTNMYQFTIDKGQLKEKIALNTRDLDFIATSAGPFGTTANGIPETPLLVPYKVAEKLNGVKSGTIVEFEGVAHSVKLGGNYAKKDTLGAALLANSGTFMVQANNAVVVSPTNHPRDRLLCRILHSKETETF